MLKKFKKVFLALFLVSAISAAAYAESVAFQKPAIYLYPKETTKIEVKLDKSIKYKNTIPNYKKGWLVEADATGTIRDLQPKNTHCNKLPSKKFGFEYSKQACELNKYPYIYWDGKQLFKPIPKKNVGFIVKKKNIDAFLLDAATKLQLNNTEKFDFVRYWAQKMKDKKWAYYRVYFLQNAEVDAYLPLTINPNPESVNRIEIIIRKGKKNEKITPQNIIPVKREGYTMVEWGGAIFK
jgi:hypothetical protein